jgi:hypothetical protein
LWYAMVDVRIARIMADRLIARPCFGDVNCYLVEICNVVRGKQYADFGRWSGSLFQHSCQLAREFRIRGTREFPDTAVCKKGTPFRVRARAASPMRARRSALLRADKFDEIDEWPLRNSALKHGGPVASKRIRNSVSTKLPSISEKPLQLIPSPQTHTWQWVLPT